MAVTSDASDIRIIDRARQRLRWARTNALLGAACSAIFLAFAVVSAIGVRGHLREHGVAASQLFVVLSEPQQPTGISPGIIVCGVILGAMFLASALVAIAGVCSVRSRRRESRLLLALWEEHCGEPKRGRAGANGEGG